MDKAVKAGKPFFVWFNTTRMHVWTHLKKSAEGRTGIGLYPDGMVEHDDMVGGVLKQLDDLGIADNTIVVYGTDNGAETATWPDGGTTPYHGEKGTTWEGGFRVPMLVRWPGVIKPGTIVNEIFSQEDWLPTLLAAAGEPDIVEKLKTGLPGQRQDLEGPRSTATTSCRIFKGEAKKGPREEIFYFGQGGELNAVRWNDWKVHFAVTERQHRHRRPRRAGLAGDRQPARRSLREGAARVRACTSAGTRDNIWLFVPVQQKLKAVPHDAAGVSRSSRAAA